MLHGRHHDRDSRGKICRGNYVVGTHGGEVRFQDGNGNGRTAVHGFHKGLIEPWRLEVERWIA